MALPHDVQLHGRLPARYRGHQGDRRGEAGADHAPLLSRFAYVPEGPVSPGGGALRCVLCAARTTVDPAVVDAGVDDHLIENNCYDPVCFRLVLEVTSSTFRSDLPTKAAAYAEAKIPVHVVADREHRRLHVLTGPAGRDHAAHRVRSPGERVVLPASLGAEVTLDVTGVLEAGRRKQAADRE
ncbi:hypothetical protein GTU99_27765 [Streptomyces sp. PRKS01-65]|nr:hypothetical protein [Streptomyces harenosi]